MSYGSELRRRSNISRALKRRAVVMQCPQCQRKNALVRKWSTDKAVSVTKCRWCPYQRERILEA